jgi:hypothetical protein
MIGAELLNLMYGNPYNQFAGAMNPNPAPNPNPNAPPQLQNTPPGGKLPPGAMPPPAQGGPPMGGGIRPVGGPPMPAGGQQPQGGPTPQPGAQPPPGPPPGQQGLPPTAATQSPPDLASLYLQMEQRNRSANEIDHGLNMMAAAFSSPSMANAIMGSSRGQGQDPGAQLSNLIMLQNMQRMQSVPAPTGIDPTVWNALPPDAKTKYIESQGAANIDIAKQGAEEKQKDLLDAQQKAPASLQQMSDMDAVANQLKGPLNSALTSIVASPTARIAAEKLLETDPKLEPGDAMRQVYAGMLNSDQLAALNQLKKLDAQVYSDAFQSTGSRRTQQEVASLKTGLSPLKNFNQSPDAYMAQFNDFQNQLHKTMNNTYGAAGRIDEIPDNMKWDMSDPNNPKPLVDSAYLPNGNKYAGNGGQWASNPPKSNFDYASIPSGTVYTAPDGTQRRKP